jgi:dimethylamine monooxygenase subunit A
MLKYFPFKEIADLRMGTLPLKENEQLIEIEDDYLKEIELKNQLLTDDHPFYYRTSAEAGLAQWDVLEILCNEMSINYPQYYLLEKNGEIWHWENKILNTKYQFIFGKNNTLPLEPLDWIGRQVQEDLIILSNDETSRLIGGQLCFANGWSLESKWNQSFMGVHKTTPNKLNQTMHYAQKLLEGLKLNRPVWRMSWNMKLGNQLDFTSKHTANYNHKLKMMAPKITESNVANEVFVRIERQTFTRLKRSGCILFALHTYQNTIGGEAKDKNRAKNLLGVLKTTPREMLDYKAVTPFEKPLLAFLENCV